MQTLCLAELLAGLSVVADIGMGLEPGQAARASLVAVELAAVLGEPEPSTIYYTSLLQHIGCTAYAHEAAALLGGDEIAVKRAALRTDFANVGDVLFVYLPHLAPAAPPLTRLRAAAVAAARSKDIVQGYSQANCEVAARTAERIGLGRGVVGGLTDVYEQWDGNGGARRLRGEAIHIAARIAQVAITASLFYGLGGFDAALEALRHRAGKALDPHLVELVHREGRRILSVLAVADPVSEAVKAEPKPSMRIAEAHLDAVCRAFGEVVDLKTPLHHGHSTAVAELAAKAAQQCGLDAPEIKRIRQGALLHDLGRAAVPNAVWARPGPLSWTDQERVRLHAYHSERVLARCGPLVELAPLAGMHHERLDGSGYHRQAAASAIGFGARLIAAADVFHALTQARAHRPAHSPDEASHLLATEARAGRLDVEAVRAIVAAAGQSSAAVARARPAGLTERQVEVLRLVARGLSNQQIADRLIVTRRTAEHHVQDVYARIGVSSRAAAALYAMEHDLLA